jgi:hypothetical protein
MPGGEANYALNLFSAFGGIVLQNDFAHPSAQD